MAFIQLVLFFASVLGSRALQVTSTWDVERPVPKTDEVQDGDVLKAVHLQAKTSDRFDAIQASISDLEESIAEQEQATFDDINAKKASYQQRLLAQREETGALMEAVQHTEETLAALQANVSRLRGQAKDLEKDNEVLYAELKDIRRNVGTAAELAELALNFSGLQLLGAQELQVLSELDGEDRQARHQRDLSKFSGKSTLSLLTVVDADLHTELLESPEEMIQRLGETLGEAAETHTAAVAKLEEGYQRLLAEGESKHNKLLERHAALNATVAEIMQTQDRLIKAVQSLNQTKEELTQRVNALRTFGDKLGGISAAHGEPQKQENAITKAVRKLDETTEAFAKRVHKIFNGRKSLLQTASLEQPVDLHAQQDTKDMFRDAKTGVTELQEAVEAQASMSLQEIKARKTEHAERLTEQRAAIQADERINNLTHGEIKMVKHEIDELRRQADGLMNENVALADQLQVMQKNLSTAMDFVNASVRFAAQRIQEDPDLQVLNDLRLEDAQKYHQDELNDLASLSSVSMLLELDNVIESSPKTPDEFVGVLRTSLDAAVAERNTSLSKLDAAFHALLAKSEERHAEVLRVQARLNQTLADTKVTRDRLEQAVSHLRTTKDALSNKIEAIRAFGSQRLGAAASARFVEKQKLRDARQAALGQTLWTITQSSESETRRADEHAQT